MDRPEIIATPEQEAKAQEIANRYGGGAIAYYAALAGILEGQSLINK